MTKVTVPLVYTGPTPSKVLTFAAKSAGEAVELELGYPECPAPWKGVVKLTGARLELPAPGTEGKPKVRLTVVLARDDTREPRELLGFLLDAAAALELEACAKIVQAPLPFPSEDEEEDPDEPLPGEKPRRARGS